MFSAFDIRVSRGRRPVLGGATLQVRPGEVVALLGANGAGKSTLLSVLAGELRGEAAVHGKRGVMLNGCDLAKLDVAAQARSRTVLPQKPSLAFDLDVTEVVAMGAYPFPGLSQDDIDILSRRVLDKADISHLAARRYLELSGGEQQRVQFARVMLQILAERQADPRGRYMLLDEPTASLDPQHQQLLLGVVRELALTGRIGVVLVIHDVNLAALWSDRIALLSDGVVVACDTPENVLTPESLRRVYGVAVHVMAHPRQPGKPLVVFG